MSQEFYTPMEVADLLKIKKSTVYELIKRGELKCIKVGKQFRVLKNDLDLYLNHDMVRPTSNLTSQEEQINQEDRDLIQSQSGRSTNRGVVVCGQDILLEILCNYMSRELKNTPIYRSYQGSYNGLYALYQDEVDVATVHLFDGVTGEYNKDYVKRMLPGTRYIRVHLVNRMQGFYVQSGNPKNIRGFRDLSRSDVTMINREKGSGTRILLDEKLLSHGIHKSQVKGYEREVNSHLACAGAIARKSADVSIGIERISKEMAGVEFIPIQMESYDLVVKEEYAGSDWFKSILGILKHSDFRAEIMGMSGYDITDMGEVI
ncbi:MAG: substrate-binding domain-containing protein [Anaerocolumna sp.]